MRRDFINVLSVAWVSILVGVVVRDAVLLVETLTLLFSDFGGV